MAKSKLNRIQLRVEEEPLAESERQKKRAELERRFPGGLAVINLRMERIPDANIHIDNPRPDDKVKPVGLTSMPVPVYVYKGTHPSTGLPDYEKQTRMVIHAEPAPGRADGPIPRELRTDAIPGLSPHMDKWDVLEFYLEHPLCGIDYTVKPVDLTLDEKLRDAMKKPGAKAALKQIEKQGAILDNAKAGPPKPKRPVNDDEEEDVVGELYQEEEEALVDDEFVEEEEEAFA